MKTVLNIVGIPDDNKIKIVKNVGDMQKFTFELDGNSNLITGIVSDEITIYNTVFGGMNQKIEFNLSPDIILFNSIADGDSHKKALNSLLDFSKQVSLKIINHPTAVLNSTREKIYNKLKNLPKIIVPKTIKVTPNSILEVEKLIKEQNFPFPFIFRTTSEHGSKNMTKIDSFDELSKLDMFALNGQNSFYMIEYIDYKSDDNIYRKIRYWIVGNKVIPRHLVVSDEWNISYQIKKEKMFDNKNYQKEELDLLNNSNKELEDLSLFIKENLGLDFFGIDCSIDKNGNMIIFEATPAMGLLYDYDFPYTHKSLETTVLALEELIKNITTNRN